MSCYFLEMCFGGMQTKICQDKKLAGQKAACDFGTPDKNSYKNYQQLLVQHLVRNHALF